MLEVSLLLGLQARGQVKDRCHRNCSVITHAARAADQLDLLGDQVLVKNDFLISLLLQVIQHVFVVPLGLLLLLNHPILLAIKALRPLYDFVLFLVQNLLGQLVVIEFIAIEVLKMRAVARVFLLDQAHQSFVEEVFHFFRASRLYLFQLLFNINTFLPFLLKVLKVLN